MPQGKSALCAHLNWLTSNHISILANRYMITVQFRSGREKARKREISRDFSRFFAPVFFRNFIDPFSPFRCCVRIRTHEKGFLRTYESGRICGWIRTCEKKVPEPPPSRCSQIVYRQNRSLLKLTGFELAKLSVVVISAIPHCPDKDQNASLV